MTRDDTQPALDDAGVPKVGTVFIERYRILGVLGKGGMSIVLEAEQLPLGRIVAIKFLRKHSAKRAARLIREARTVAALQSSHVVRVIEAGQVEDIAYIAMERLQGSNLRELLIARGVLPIADVVRFALHACEALHEAHERSIVHRDIKPSNLFVCNGDDGESILKILDFGVSKIGSPTLAREAFTETGALLGTPLYMAPEQLRSARAADVRSDIWSLGATIFECVSGRPAFEADSLPGLGASIVSDDPPDLLEVRPDAPAQLAEIVARCLKKDPASRYASAQDLFQALERLSTQLRERPPGQVVVGAQSPANSDETETEDTPGAFGLGRVLGSDPAGAESSAGPTQTSVTVPLSVAQKATRWPWLVAAVAALGFAAWVLGSGPILGGVNPAGGKKYKATQVTRSAGATLSGTVASGHATDGPGSAATQAASASVDAPTASPPISSADSVGSALQHAHSTPSRASKNSDKRSRATKPVLTTADKSRPSAPASSTPAPVSSGVDPLEFRD